MIRVRYIGGWSDGMEVSWQSPPNVGDEVQVAEKSMQPLGVTSTFVKGTIQYDVYRIEYDALGRLVAVWQRREERSEK